nr:hypothetical protein [Curtobacterium sp. VKM Ac-2852]
MTLHQVEAGPEAQWSAEASSVHHVAEGGEVGVPSAIVEGGDRYASVGRGLTELSRCLWVWSEWLVRDDGHSAGDRLQNELAAGGRGSGDYDCVNAGSDQVPE